MDQLGLSPEAQTTLTETYKVLQIVNRDLRKAHASVLWASMSWKSFQDGPDDPDRPVQWVDPARAPVGLTMEDFEWVAGTRIETKAAMIDTLKSLADRKESLEKTQGELRQVINELSRPGLRSWEILDLPDETLSLIFEFVEEVMPDLFPFCLMDSRDIQNCRLTCQRFCNLSSQFLLRCVSVDLSRSSISRFEEISRHPIISKGVCGVRVVLHFYDPFLSGNIDEFIRYNAATLEDIMERLKAERYHYMPDGDGVDVINTLKDVVASWRRIAEPEGQSLTESNPTQLELLRIAHQNYQRLCSDQEGLSNSGEFSQTVAAGIARMPRARVLQLVDSHSPKMKHPRFFHREDINAQLHEMMLLPMDYATARRYGVTPRLCNTITQLPAATLNVGAWLERIDIKLPYMGNRSDLLPGFEVQQLLPSAMKRLDRFYFQGGDWINRDLDAEILYHTFGPFLDTSSLKDIVIDISGYGEPEDNSVLDVSNLINLRQWENLSYVFLRGVAFHLSELRLFARRNHKNPDTLWMERVRLLSGSWAEALDTLRETGGGMTLDNPLGAECDDMAPDELQGIFGKENSRAMSQGELYVRRLKDSNPLRR